MIQKTFGTDFYEAETKQEIFTRFLKKIGYRTLAVVSELQAAESAECLKQQLFPAQ